MSSGSLYSSSFSPNNDQYKDVYHKKVLTEKAIKNHHSSDDELAWLYKCDKFMLWSTVPARGYGITWLSADFAHYDTIALTTETKPHLEISEPVRKAINRKPPQLLKKFGQAYSNRGAGFNKSFNNRQFSRKSF